eukprot:TRINITY_DN529_c2_g1_i2.p1 TRINITY_DN529_c2_g1~~TRINITY_DN529_c2_g1_i2.p1  ORF type:complete len:657 (-),score=172.43 TRINITY_DN529_c2_g1_i2:126-2096(-)
MPAAGPRPPPADLPAPAPGSRPKPSPPPAPPPSRKPSMVLHPKPAPPPPPAPAQHGRPLPAPARTLPVRPQKALSASACSLPVPSTFAGVPAAHTPAGAPVAPPPPVVRPTPGQMTRNNSGSFTRPAVPLNKPTVPLSTASTTAVTTASTPHAPSSPVQVGSTPSPSAQSKRHSKEDTPWRQYSTVKIASSDKFDEQLNRVIAQMAKRGGSEVMELPTTKIQDTSKSLSLSKLLKGKKKGRLSKHNSVEEKDVNEIEISGPGDNAGSSNAADLRPAASSPQLQEVEVVRVEKRTSQVEQQTSEGGEAAAVEEETPTTRREHIEKEILQTEQVYLDSLTIIQDLYEMPLRKANPLIIEKEEIDLLFCNVKTIILYNTVLLKSLQQHPHTCGASFAIVTPFFKHYTEYSKNYPNALATLNRLKKNNPEFRKFLEKQAKEHSDALAAMDILDSLIIRPIQRIPRYKLLLTDLIKNVPETDPDFPALRKSLDLMLDVAMALNDSSKVTENTEKLLSIQHSLVFKSKSGEVNLVEHQRQFVREGETTAQLPNKKRPCACMLFLFSDCLLVTKKRTLSSSYAYKYKLPVEFVTAVTEDTHSPEGSSLRIKMTTPVGLFLFQCAKDEELQAWYSALVTVQTTALEKEEDFKKARAKKGDLDKL